MIEDTNPRAYRNRVSCRALSPRPRVADLLAGTEAAELARDLAAAGRRDDFRWFVRSQGVPNERLDELWRHLCRPPAAPSPR